MPYSDMLIRLAKRGDAMAVARVHVRSWQTAYRNLLPDDYLDQLRPEDRAQKYDFANLDPQKPRTIVAAENELIIGFATTAPAGEPALKGCGELCALYVDPEHWGRGVGRELISAARSHLAEVGYRDAVLWVLVGNVRAERFYKSDGWTPESVQRAVSMWGVSVNEVRYRRQIAKP